MLQIAYICIFVEAYYIYTYIKSSKRIPLFLHKIEWVNFFFSYQA